MIHTLSTMTSILLAGGGIAVIAAALIEDWQALRRALGAAETTGLSPLPPRTRRLKPARAARMIVIRPAGSPLRAAA